MAPSPLENETSEDFLLDDETQEDFSAEKLVLTAVEKEPEDLDVFLDPAATELPTTMEVSESVLLHTDFFDGPLEVLLELIHEQNIDILDIPIFKIATDFQAYVDLVHNLDLEITGDYLNMAAELTYIKSKMLLPRDPTDEDPRSHLVQKLLEYKQVRSAAKFLDSQKKLGHDVFIRGSETDSSLPDMPLPKTRTKSQELMTIFANMLRNFEQKRGPFHSVNKEKITVREQINWVCQQLEDRERVLFSELLLMLSSRLSIVVTFLALLEMSRLKHIRLFQLIEEEDIEVIAIHSLKDLELGEIDSFDYDIKPKEVSKSKENGREA